MGDIIITPDMIVAELRAVRAAAERGSDAIHLAETNYDIALAEWQEAYDDAYLLAVGTIGEREIQARKFSRDQKLALDVAKASLNRVKAKIAQLDRAQSNLQTQFKAVSVTYVEAGR